MDPSIAPTISPGGPVTARNKTAETQTERADVSGSHATRTGTASAASGVAIPTDPRVSPHGSGCFGSLSKAHWKATAQAHTLPLPEGGSVGACAELAKKIPSALEALRNCAPAAERLHQAATLADALAPAGSRMLGEAAQSMAAQNTAAQNTAAQNTAAESTDTGELVGAAGNAYDVLADLEKKLAGLDPKSDAFSRELIVLQQKIGSVTRLLETITNILDMKDQVSRNIIRNIS